MGSTTVAVAGGGAPAPLLALDAGSLKARFKQRCIETNNVFQNWQIRVHRSLSWLARAGQFAADQPEARFLYLWIALNSLYGRWDNERNAPHADTAARNAFFEEVCSWDVALVGQHMQRHRGLIKKLLQNPYLSEIYWRDPAHPKAKGHATEDANYLDRNFKHRDYCRVLCQVMQRLFVLRGQIVHGASTGGSRLNRTTLAHALQLLEILVPVIQHLAIEHARHDDWPELCYPPQG